ncbi:MAG: hypothetical protein H6742_18195 [Alphaproteobacteria bacterium]|nr:hypothetical protein [Alphaproteobacteria bacterium]
MAKTVIATLLNFFFPGAGYLLLGHKVPLAIAWLVGVIGLTYVELGIQTAAPAYYWPMFGSVFLMNIAFAVDAFQVGKLKQAGQVAAA